MIFHAHRAALLVAGIVACAALAHADSSLVKPAPTPPPHAGPTVAAAQGFCGEPSGKADELFQRYSTNAGMKQVYKSSEYIAYADDEKNPTVMYTFTTKAHAAHPAAVCRKPERQGDSLVIKMAVVCDGEATACSKLKNDFNVMTAKMQAEVNNQISAQKK